MDKLTKAQRSALMSKIRGDNLGPETRLGLAFEALEIRHVHSCKDLPGKPDFVMWANSESRFLAVFVHGCFWHRCPTHFRLPKTRTEHWRTHIGKNVARDSRVKRKLNRLGYLTATVWEHEVKTQDAAHGVAKRLRSRLLKLQGKRTIKV